MRAYPIGSLVKVRKDGNIGEVVAVLDEGKRLEVHIRTGKRLEHNPVLKEYELEHYKGV
jgi:hypothetical protein